jgi:hypothetical protein
MLPPANTLRSSPHLVDLRIVVLRSAPTALGEHLYQRLTQHFLCNLFGAYTVGTALHSTPQLCYLARTSLWGGRQ